MFMKTILTFIITLPILAGLDFLFLGYLMKDYYHKYMSAAVTIEFNLFYAFLFYFFYVIGIFVFVVFPNLHSNNQVVVIFYGLMFGFFCYMTYDLTNVATVKNWPLKLIFIDILWGTVVTGLVSFLAYKIMLSLM
jgi:uncharacterized membrane protein